MSEHEYEITTYRSDGAEIDCAEADTMKDAQGAAKTLWAESEIHLTGVNHATIKRNGAILYVFAQEPYH